MMVRHKCGISSKDRKSSEQMRQKSVADVMLRNRLSCFGNVESKDDGDY